ncbi:MAG: hypothetical protein JXN59_17225 [Anaerolineae bacterium]|nr:hypothetical protein [Anaerolineae bacterium]
MQAIKPFLLIIWAASLLLTGCGQVTDLAGVELATASPTATRPPVALVLPLSRTASKDFLGTVISLNYPEGWLTDESGQSITVYDPASNSTDRSGLGVGMFVALTRSAGVTEADERLAPLVMSRYLGRAAGGGFIAAEAAPEEGEPLAFDWGGHDAAVFRWQSADAQTLGSQILVLDEDKRRFVIISTQAPADRWPDFEATWRDMLGTFTLNGASLPFSDLQAALDAPGS